jgi:hypothetical protein
MFGLTILAGAYRIDDEMCQNKFSILAEFYIKN